MAPLMVLYEHASGYTLFRVKEFEEVAMFQPEVEKATLNLGKFKSLVTLIAYSPFTSGVSALENANALAEGTLHADLQNFLETNVPKSGKKQKVTLGVADQKLAASIFEGMGIPCKFSEVVPEILRGIRYHFDELVSGVTSSNMDTAQAGLGRSFSRSKVQFNVKKADNMIIQSIALLDLLDKDINTFSMRLREWYSYHFPELVKLCGDNYTYARVAKIVKDRKEISEREEVSGLLEEVLGDAEKAQAVIDAANSSMGMEISPLDLMNIDLFATKVVNLANYRRQLMQYLQDKMNTIAPNLSTLIGETVGARLISHAGSLINLAKYPASTVQILGAEKALFRALKTRGNTPKYGLIFHSTFIGRAAAKNKGRISRFLANKASIASRIDSFSESNALSDVFGTKLREQVEERLKFFDSGTVPKKNADVMHEATVEAAAAAAAAKAERKKRKKEKRKASLMAAEGENGNENGLNGHATPEVKAEEEQIVAEEEPIKKKKKKNKKEKAQQEVEA